MEIAGIVILAVALAAVIVKIILDKKSMDKTNRGTGDAAVRNDSVKAAEDGLAAAQPVTEKKPEFKKSVISAATEVTADGKMKSHVLKGGATDTSDEEEIKDTDNKEISFTSGLKALIVEDTPEDMERLADMLSKMNIITDTAESGLKALQQTKDDKYDMVFISYDMARMDGIQTYRNIKNTEDNSSKDAVYFALISEDSDEPEISFTREGFKEVIRKPAGKFTVQGMLAECFAAQLAEGDAETLGYLKHIARTEIQLQEFGMNYEQALDNNANDLKQIKTVASEFCDSYEDLSAEIMDYLYEKNGKAYADRMRTVRKTAETLAIRSLYEMADEHVNFAVKDNMDMAEEGWRALELKWEEVVSGLRSWLGKTDKLRNATQVLAIQTNGVELKGKELEERLAAVKNHIEKGSLKNAGFTLEDICHYELTGDDRQRVNNILSKLQAGENDAALELLA